MMKFSTKLTVTAMAGIMALSMAACGNASVDNMPKSDTNRPSGRNNTEVYDSNRAYRYTGPADNKGNVRRDMKNAVDNMGRAAGDFGRDLKRDAKDASDDIKKDMNRAMDNGRTRADTKNSMMNHENQNTTLKGIN